MWTIVDQKDGANKITLLAKTKFKNRAELIPLKANNKPDNSQGQILPQVVKKECNLHRIVIFHPNTNNLQLILQQISHQAKSLANWKCKWWTSTKRDTTINKIDSKLLSRTWEFTKGQDMFHLRTCQKWEVFTVDGNKIILTWRMKHKNSEVKFSKDCDY